MDYPALTPPAAAQTIECDCVVWSAPARLPVLAPLRRADMLGRWLPAEGKRRGFRKSFSGQQLANRVARGGEFVTHYRVYKLAAPKGRIVKGKDMEAASDAEALKKAEADDDCPICEVWQSAHKVGSID